ncbi:hypothetical protein AFLA_013530 [Aspergillus flavus NRRL3357]|nr:hypothetical protein AFLA_013530 [Aspergillus flavus NRRL3357]
MPEDIGDFVARSIARHAAIALVAPANLTDAVDAADGTDAMDASDATVTHSSGDGQVCFGSSQDVNTTQGPANIDDAGNVSTYPKSGTDVSKHVSPNDVLK